MAVTDGGRQIIVSESGQTFPVTVGPPCNMKITAAWWQDTVASTDTVSFTDQKGRTFTYKASTDLIPIDMGKLDWLEGPITITQMSSGILYFILGNK